MQSWLIIDIVALCFTAIRATRPGVIQEICLMEVFEARCPAHHVIVMQTALYGRMRINHCDPTNSYNIGCVANAINHIDSTCSGKRQCDAVIPDQQLHALNQCPQGAMPYLEAMYECVPVLPDELHVHACQLDGVIILDNEPHGTIASSAVFSTNLGSGRCRWVLEAQPGQRINVTLYDFGVEASGAAGRSSSCTTYVRLVEAQAVNPTILCSGSERIRQAYLSISHRLEISFDDSHSMDIEPSFLIEYTFVGCPDPDLQGNALIERSPDKAVLHCKATGEKITLRCQSDAWSGDVEECKEPSGIDRSIEEFMSEEWSPMKVIVFVVGIFVGFIAVTGLACLVWFCIRNCRRSHKKPEPFYYVHEPLRRDNTYSGRRHSTGDSSLPELSYNTCVRRQPPVPHHRTQMGNSVPFLQDYDSGNETENHTTMSSVPSTANTLPYHDHIYDRPAC